MKFLDKSGDLHYGWIRVANKVTEAKITAFAYETIPNKPILAGATSETADEATLAEPTNPVHPKGAQSASLGYLALGASGIAAWRREEEVVAQ